MSRSDHPIAEEDGDTPNSRTERQPRVRAPRILPQEEVFDALVIAGVPLGPLCDSRSLLKASISTINSQHTAAPGLVRLQQGSAEGWSLNLGGGSVVSSLGVHPQGLSIHTSGALDVYAGLLLMLKRHDYPESGVVRIGRRELLTLIGWDNEDGKIGGAQYKRLLDALHAIRDWSLHQTAVGIPTTCPHHGASAAAPLSPLRVLSSVESVSALRRMGGAWDDRPDAGHRADDIVLEFTPEFLGMLRDPSTRVSYRMTHYFGLRPGTPRALYRFVRSLEASHRGIAKVTIPLDDLLAGIGSTLRGVVPARARTIIGKAEDEFVEKGLLRSPIKYGKSGSGARQATLALGTPPTEEFKGLLFDTLRSFGVTSAMARQFVDSNVEWTAMVIAATCRGMLSPRESLGAMLHNYCSHPEREPQLDPFQLPSFKPLPGQRRTKTTSHAMAYLEHVHDGARAHFAAFSMEDYAGLRATVAGTGRPDWVVDGLMVALGHSWSAGQSLSQYLSGAKIRGGRSQGAG